MMALFEFLDPGTNGENINYWLSGKKTVKSNSNNDKLGKQGRTRFFQPFLTICRLRQRFAEQHLANLFQIPQSTVSRILITWINFMYLKLGQLNIWPSRKLVDETMPKDFKAKYPSITVIIECTEIRSRISSSLLLTSELFSSYKHHTSLKGLEEISPKGSFSFIGQLYTGSISDREMVERSGFLNLPFSTWDSIMAEKGFTIEDILPLGISLDIPPFLGMSELLKRSRTF